MASATIPIADRNNREIALAAHQPLIAVQCIGIDLLGKLLSLRQHLFQVLIDNGNAFLKIGPLGLHFGRDLFQRHLLRLHRRLKFVTLLHHFQLMRLNLVDFLFDLGDFLQQRLVFGVRLDLGKLCPVLWQSGCAWTRRRSPISCARPQCVSPRRATLPDEPASAFRRCSAAATCSGMRIRSILSCAIRRSRSCTNRSFSTAGSMTFTISVKGRGQCVNAAPDPAFP